MTYLYLHGFGSSPKSRKAVFFHDQLARRGIDLVVPALAQVFRRTAISDALAIAERHLGPDTVLFGSSMGGYLATLVASRNPDKVRALVLFAPAFDIRGRWRDRVGEDGIARWRAAGEMDFLNTSSGREEPLDYRFYEDALAHPPRPEVRCPALVLAGRKDDVVPLHVIEPFAHGVANRRMFVLESGHELTDVLDEMWDHTWRFLGEVGAVKT
jgi:pimeloyl-ACP methyl ester carboxylesterase